MKTLLIDSQYFPSVEYYSTLVKCHELKIERYEHYQKVTYRNRCYVAGPNGKIILSVPLEKGKNQRTIMKDVRISYSEPWQAMHWKTLISAYRRSPWFEFFEDDLAPFFEKRFPFLLDWNLAVFELVNSLLGIEVAFGLTENFQKSYPEASVSDLRDTILPRAWSEIPDERYPVYTQVFGDRVGFLPNLSILDLLFCEGKRAKEILLNA